MYLANVGVKCPKCKVRFNSRQLPIYVESGRRNSELRQDFGQKNPQFEKYTVCTCPSCGLADWMTAFPPTKEAAVLEQPHLPAHLQFANAALACERARGSSYKLGFFYLYAAWCADDINAHGHASEYRKQAIRAFLKCLTDGTCPPAQRGEIEYLIGELFRRAGDFANAQEYFRSTISVLPAQFAFMARRLMRRAELGNAEPISFQKAGGQ
jgi:uncharacterized protein (DUF2225 family)